jgi:hypothetical protein
MPLRERTSCARRSAGISGSLSTATMLSLWTATDAPLTRLHQTSAICCGVERATWTERARCVISFWTIIFFPGGVRTTATSDAGFNPIGYHNGTVWPHDNSLIAAGLARYGFRQEANRIAAAMIEAAAAFQYRLPEVFAGYPRRETGFPVEYPTASSPQAWAAGAPLLLLSTLLGLRTTPEGELKADPVLPKCARSIVLDGIRHRGSRYRLRADHEQWELMRL